MLHLKMYEKVGNAAFLQGTEARGNLDWLQVLQKLNVQRQLIKHLNCKAK